MNPTIEGDYKKFREEHAGFGSMKPTMEQKMKTIQKDETMKRLQVRYVKYFKHWRDFDLLTMILAMIGLVLMMVDVSTSLCCLR